MKIGKVNTIDQHQFVVAAILFITVFVLCRLGTKLCCPGGYGACPQDAWRRSDSDVRTTT